MTLRAKASFVSRFVLLLVFCGILAACEETVTAENYDQIQVDMALHEVESIMGGKGEDITPSGTNISGGGLTSGSNSSEKTYSWRDGSKEITVTVADGKVVRKAKAGL